MNIKKIKVGFLETNCYLLISNKEVAIVDPGGEPDKILKELTEIEDKKVKYIINTHHHNDHIAANEETKKETGAKILIHKLESNFIEFKVDQFLQEGDKIIIGNEKIKVINTPGHTKGGICLIGEDFILTGDTLFYQGYGRTDLEGGSVQEMKKSLERLSKIIKPGMKVFPGHGESFIYKKS
jgi:glyoxylase-like metal-dependent hydrolase (beta-lactamase superfamily II)